MVVLERNIQLQFDLPDILYSNDQILMCCGYVEEVDGFDQVELIMDNEVIGKGGALPRFCCKKNHLKLNAFNVIAKPTNFKNKKYVSF